MVSEHLKPCVGGPAGGVLATVDDDVLWLDPLLQHALLGVLPSAPEQTGGLDPEVPDALPVVVQQAEAIVVHNLLVGLLYHLHGGGETVEPLISPTVLQQNL